MKSKTNKLIKNTMILSFGNLCTKGLMFIMTPLLIRWMTQESYGTFDLLITYVTILIPLVTLSIGEATFRFLVDKNSENLNSKIINSSFFVTLIGFAFSTILLVVLYIFIESFRSYIPYLFILLLCEGMNNFITYIIRGLKKLPVYALSNICFVFTMCISSIILVYKMKLGLLGIVVSYSIGYLLSSLIGLKIIRKNCNIFIKEIDFKLIKDMLKYSLPMMPTSICWWIVNVSDRTIVSAFLGTSVNAIYAVANKIPNICQTFYSVFHLSWQESVVETKSDKDKDKYYNYIMNNMFVLLSSISIIIIACDFLFYKIIFTKKYFDGYYQVPILVISLIFSALSQFIGGIYISRMQSKKNGTTTVIAAIVNLFVHLILIRYIGLYAATLSTFVSYLVLFIIRFVDIRKSIKLYFNKNSIIIFCFLLYFFVTVYVNNLVLNFINLILSIFIFIFINKVKIKKIIYKVGGKLC